MDGERRASSAFLLGAATLVAAATIFGAILVVLWARDDVRATVTGRLWMGVQLAWPAIAVVGAAWLAAGLLELRRTAGPAAVVAACGFGALGVVLVVNVWFQIGWIPTHADELEPETMRRFYEWTSLARCGAAVVAGGGLLAMGWPRVELPHVGALLLAPLAYPSPAIQEGLDAVLGKGWSWTSYGGRIVVLGAFLACAVLVVRAARRPAPASPGERGDAVRAAALALAILAAALIAAAGFLGVAFDDRDHAAVRAWPYVFPLAIGIAVVRVFTGLVRAAWAPTAETPERRLLLAAGAILAGVGVELQSAVAGFHVARMNYVGGVLRVADPLAVAGPAAILVGLLLATSGLAHLAGARASRRLGLPVALLATALTAGAVAVRRVVFDAIVAGDQGATPVVAVVGSTVLEGLALAVVAGFGLRVAADLRAAAATPLPTAELRE